MNKTAAEGEAGVCESKQDSFSWLGWRQGRGGAETEQVCVLARPWAAVNTSKGILRCAHQAVGWIGLKES